MPVSLTEKYLYQDLLHEKAEVNSKMVATNVFLGQLVH